MGVLSPYHHITGRAHNVSAVAAVRLVTSYEAKVQDFSYDQALTVVSVVASSVPDVAGVSAVCRSRHATS